MQSKLECFIAQKWIWTFLVWQISIFQGWHCWGRSIGMASHVRCISGV